LRKTKLDRLLARRPDGIFVAPFEQGEIGPELFRAACRMGLEGLVSKRRDKPYQAGRSKHWIKIKNRKHPAMSRVMEAFRQGEGNGPSPGEAGAVWNSASLEGEPAQLKMWGRNPPIPIKFRVRSA
jgi:hypothetical protein